MFFNYQQGEDDVTHVIAVDTHHPGFSKKDDP